tara:strand:+ start:307 stop:648 length:342 start_codon:yes stop_codon:yes gene_type:complete
MLQKKVYIVTITFASLVMGANIWISVINNPSGTIVTPIPPNVPEYVCKEDQSASECAQLKLTCGNGIPDSGEDCQNCSIDNGCPSGLLCGNLNGGEYYICHYPAGLCLADPAR